MSAVPHRCAPGRRTPRRSRAVAASAVVLLLFAGCSQDERTPAVPEAPGPHTAVTPRQAAMVLGAVDEALSRAASSGDVTAAGTRLTGPARESLAATILVERAQGRRAASPPSPTAPKLILTRMDSWPRWFMAAGATPRSAVPALRVLVSPDARSPYGLWAQLELLPGQQLPETALPSTGADPLPPDARGLVKTPAEVLAHYTELLNRGDASAYRADFAADAYRTELNDQLRSDRKLILTSGTGRVLASHRTGPQAPYALPTRDGGALVVGRVDQRYVVTVAAGRGPVRLDAQLSALAGRTSVTARVERRSVEVLAFHVPKAGSSALTELVAAARTHIAATGK
jgi:hypothetical protein